MSAWLCSDKHLSIIVNATRKWPTSFDMGRITRLPDVLAVNLREDVANEHEALFEVLLKENQASLLARYPGDDEYAGIDRGHRYDPTAMPKTAVQLVKLIDSYEYQSCEHDGWVSSDAKKVCDMMRRRAWDLVPGYEKAEWSV